MAHIEGLRGEPVVRGMRVRQRVRKDGKQVAGVPNSPGDWAATGPAHVQLIDDRCVQCEPAGKDPPSRKATVQPIAVIVKSDTKEKWGIHSRHRRRAAPSPAIEP